MPTFLSVDELASRADHLFGSQRNLFNWPAVAIYLSKPKFRTLKIE
jgi:hypothetical protein